MSAARGLDKPAQQAVGIRLEWIYHTSKSIHDIAARLIAADGAGQDSASLLWAIQELSRGQARELELLAERLQGTGIGYYAEHFKDAAFVGAPA